MWMSIVLPAMLYLYFLVLLIRYRIRFRQRMSELLLPPFPGQPTHERVEAATSRDEPFTVHCSGVSIAELRLRLRQELNRRIAEMPPELEAVPGSLSAVYPVYPVRGLYHGSISIRLRVKPVA